MATAKITQTFPDGNTFEILLDSDLDSLADVTAEAMKMWQESVVDEA